MLRILLIIVGLILNSEPFFNEAGYDAIKDREGSAELSRTYNEGVVASLLQSMVQLVKRPMPVFREEILSHFKQKIER